MSRTLYLVGCGKAKRSGPAVARELYTGALFAKSIAYAEAQSKRDERGLVRILSALHGLVSPHETIEPYDLHLGSLRKAEREAWGERVARQLHQTTGIAADDIYVVLAGAAYADALDFGLRAYTRRVCVIRQPMAGMSQGHRLQWLNAQLAELDVGLSAFRATADGFDSATVVLARTGPKARHVVFLSMREAGYRVRHQDIRVTRASDYDPIQHDAGFVATKCYSVEGARLALERVAEGAA